MLLSEERDYRAILRRELERRKNSSPQYSLRSYARDLKIVPQHLSLVMNGKKGLSVASAASIAERFEWSPAEASFFCDLVAMTHARSPSARRLAAYRLQAYRPQSTQKSLDMDIFQAISDGKHVALLELIDTTDFKNKPEWIATRLGISTFEVSEILKRLKRVGLVEEAKGGGIRKTHLRLTTTHDIPSAALKKFSREMLSKAIEAIASQSVDERDISTITMAINPRRLPEVKNKIANFRRELCAFLEEGERTEVYTFVPALFRLTIKKTKEISKP